MIPQYRLIKINDYWAIVSDEEIKAGMLTLDYYNNIRPFVDLSGYGLGHGLFLKLIAQYPKPIHPNIPLFDLPGQLEDDVEKMAGEYADNFSITKKLFEWQASYRGFNAGYNKAKEKYQFTKEDAERCFNAGREHVWNDYQIPRYPSFKEYYSTIEQPKEYIVELVLNEDGSPQIKDGKITIKNIL